MVYVERKIIKLTLYYIRKRPSTGAQCFKSHDSRRLGFLINFSVNFLQCLTENPKVIGNMLTTRHFMKLYLEKSKSGSFFKAVSLMSEK